MTDTTFRLEADFTFRPHEPLISEMRDAVRYRFATGGHLLIGDDNHHFRIWPADLSKTGIGFYANWPLDPGTPLTAVLSGRAGTDELIPARVVHSTRRPASGWLIGCEFVTPLDAKTLNRLLGKSE